MLTSIAACLDVDYLLAVDLPSSELSSSTRGGACPLQWLPVLLAVVGMPPPPPQLPPINCADTPNTFPKFSTFGDCYTVIPKIPDDHPRDISPAMVCAWTGEVMTNDLADFGVIWTPPARFSKDALISQMCPATCATYGVYAPGCAPSPPVPPFPPAPPSRPPAPSPPLAPVIACATDEECPEGFTCSLLASRTARMLLFGSMLLTRGHCVPAAPGRWIPRER